VLAGREAIGGKSLPRRKAEDSKGKQNPGVRSQKKRKSVAAVLSLFILASGF
jgi:hypothetical protein